MFFRCHLTQAVITLPAHGHDLKSKHAQLLYIVSVMYGAMKQAASLGHAISRTLEDDNESPN